MQDAIDPEVWRARRDRMKARHPGMGDMGMPLGLAVRLLPTPRTSDTNGAGSHGDGGPDLRTAVSLLPTPRASDTGTPGRRSSDGFRPPLSQVVLPLATYRDETASSEAPEPTDDRTAWGPYAAAVERWETLTREAPPPIDEQGRLSPAFVEWLMGLPEHHVTGVDGLSRGAQLKALGNGVVPQQAAAALRLLLDRFDDVRQTV
ncbi:hypothetical protein [Streptomyces sp. NPDC059649]|uniref:hypothetical protein n=1 Tax=Streptomyces sp. NPDC059649 TaxID=3346895 RepID=UPI00369537A0